MRHSLLRRQWPQRSRQSETRPPAGSYGTPIGRKCRTTRPLVLTFGSDHPLYGPFMGATMTDNLGKASTAAFGSQDDVSTLRLYLLRLMYLANFVGLALNVWPALVSPPKPIALLPGVAFAFWAALSTLSALGLRY